MVAIPLASIDGFIFPSICDVIRNLSGIFKQHKLGKFVKYMDFPQNFLPQIGGVFYQQEMEHVLEYIKEINGVEVTTEKLNHSIELYNKMYDYSLFEEEAKRCALIAVDEIIDELTKTPKKNQILTYNGFVNENTAHISENTVVYFTV